MSSISGALAKDAPTAESRSYWMSQGVKVALRGDFQAAQFRFDAANGWVTAEASMAKTVGSGEWISAAHCPRD